jgi:hypothetical protein
LGNWTWITSSTRSLHRWALGSGWFSPVIPHGLSLRGTGLVSLIFFFLRNSFSTQLVHSTSFLCFCPKTQTTVSVLSLLGRYSIIYHQSPFFLSIIMFIPLHLFSYPLCIFKLLFIYFFTFKICYIFNFIRLYKIK